MTSIIWVVDTLSLALRKKTEFRNYLRSWLQKNQLDAIQKKLVELSNLIQPAYFGVPNVAEVQGENVFVLYCPGGDNRPYSAPVSLSKKRKDHGYWIRWYNSTVQANQQEKRTFFLSQIFTKFVTENKIGIYAKYRRTDT
jgi:hypothetical protein